MRLFITLSILFLAANAYAASSFLIIAEREGYVPVSVKLDIKADYVAMPLHISCDDKNSSKRLEKTQQAFKIVTERALKDNTIDIKKGIASLSAEELSSFSFSKSYYDSTVDLYVLGAIKESGDVFSVTQSLIKFVSALPEIDDVEFSTGTTKLGILNPEQYRNELTKLLVDDAKKLKAELGGFQNVEISGLESPVLVSQRDESHVTLYIPYKLTIKK